MYKNLEKQYAGMYIGFAPLSGAWRIARLGNVWVAKNLTGRDSLGYVIRSTLREVSNEIKIR